MSYRTEESDIVVLNLPQWEGQQLSALLEHSINEANQEADLCALIAAMDSLSEADALARWKRQDLDFELRPEEAVALLQAIELAKECCTRCAAAVEALIALPAKLRTVLESRRASAGRPPAAPVLTQFATGCVLESPVGVQ